MRPEVPKSKHRSGGSTSFRYGVRPGENRPRDRPRDVDRPHPQPARVLYGVPRADGLGFEFRSAKNPNRPQIDPKSRAVADAVVFLRGIEPSAGRPWDLPAVRVEVGDGQIAVVQGQHRGGAGFVRRGDVVTFCSTEHCYHVVRGRGDAFFGVTLPEPDRPAKRTVTKPGRIDLSSGTGLYWAQANLFVADHPYLKVTDSDGRFTLDRVPAGNAELVIRLPNWERSGKNVTLTAPQSPDKRTAPRLSE